MSTRYAVVDANGIVINVVKLEADWNNPLGDPKNRWAPPEGCRVVIDPAPEVIDHPSEAGHKMLSHICAEIGDEHDGVKFKGARYEKAARDFEAKLAALKK